MELQCADKEAYMPKMLTYIFWHILMDSHQYFNKIKGKPRSNLSFPRESLRSCVVPAPMNCPIEDLIGSRNDKRGGKPEGYGHDRENGRGVDKLQKTREMGGENPNWLKELQSQGKICHKLNPE